MKDLNLGKIKPIAGFVDQSFSGSIDGDFHTISYTLNLADDGLRNVGLIGNLSGTIKNLNIKNAKIDRSPTDEGNKSKDGNNNILAESKEMKYNSVGLLVCNLSGTVENVGVTESAINLDFGKCYVSDETNIITSSNSTNIGLLIGLVQNGSVSLCHIKSNSINVFSQKIFQISVGAVIGQIDGGTLKGIASNDNKLNDNSRDNSIYTPSFP